MKLKVEKIECKRSRGCILKGRSFTDAGEYARHLVKVHKDRPSEAAMAAADFVEEVKE